MNEMNFGLMQFISYNNGHDYTLADKINLIGNHPIRKDMLFNILAFMANIYVDEVENVIGVKPPYSVTDAETFAYDILTNVCDDSDLKTIISFCRINELLPQDNKYHKNEKELNDYFNQSFFKLVIRAIVLPLSGYEK